jgi:hypothetical protein
MRPLGDLIKSQPLPKTMWPASAAAAYRLFYQGLAYHGGRRLVTGSAFIPEGEAPEGGWPVVAFAHGTTGLGDAAAPSRAGLSKPEKAHVDGWLKAGYAVAATDYEGLATPGPHPYFNGEAVADDVIDAVRATHQLGHPVSPKWLVSGFSQGGHAAMFTALIATGYAPELDFRGTAAFGPPVSLHQMFDHVTTTGNQPVAPITPIVLAGLRVCNPDFDPRDFLTPRGLQLLEQAERASLLDMLRATVGVDNDGAGITNAAKRPEVAAVVSKVDVPVVRFDRPVFVTAGENDEYIPAAFVEPFVTALREAGTDAGYQVCGGANHVQILADGLAPAIAWAANVMRHSPARSTAKGRFSLLDASGDGYLARDDYQAYALRLVTAMGEPPGSPKAKAVREGYLRLWQAISQADTDRDRRVSEAEFLAWTGQTADFAADIAPLARAVIALASSAGEYPPTAATPGSGSATGSAAAAGSAATPRSAGVTGSVATPGSAAVAGTQAAQGPGPATLSSADVMRLLGAGRIPVAEAMKIVSALDTDGSGEITVDEIVANIHGFCKGENDTGYWLFGSF